MSKKHILITGGAGFIGVNVARFYLSKKHRVTILDNFSRKGNKENIQLLKASVDCSRLKIVKHDIRNYNKKLIRLVSEADIIFHLAGQVAVTTSIENPREDFEINAAGTINMLEATRLSKKNPILIYSSTNKVYGNLDKAKIIETSKRYKFKTMTRGVNEEYPVDFYSPYGCSKGASEQYVHDYARIYGLRTIVFRQSCIYGPNQFGIEDQGWIAWFIIAFLLGRDITIFGNGKQVRDLLHINDLINAYDLAIKNIDTTHGQIYNIGGGSKNSISIWSELEPILNNISGNKIKVKYKDFRAGDQMIYISDFSKAKNDFKWYPRVSIEKGISDMYDWVINNKDVVSRVFNS